MMNTNDHDPMTRRGIIILSVCLVLLVGFFFWYSKRADRYQISTESTGESVGLLSRIFSPAAKEPAATATEADADTDGLSDKAEASAGTDVNKTDSDNDLLSDGEEVLVYKTNPRLTDSDNDGMSDGDEISNSRDPLNGDPAAIWPPRPTDLTL